jgi:hypothetical protein
MKKQMYGIIGLSAAVVVLGGGLAVLKLTDSSDKGGSSSAAVSDNENVTKGVGLVLVEDGSKLPGSHTADEEHYHGVVDSVKVKNSSGELEAVRTSADDAETTAYTLKGYEDVKLDTALVKALVYNVDNIASTSIIEENCTDMDKFGLADTAVELDVTYTSGVERKLFIGDVSPVTSNTYARVEGSDTVYTVSSGNLSNYSKELKDFVSATLLDDPGSTSQPKVESLRLEREDIDYDIYLEYSENSDITKSGGSSAKHVMVEPVSALLKVESSADITNGMFGLKAEDIVAVHCTDKDIEDAGLKKPFCRVTMKLEGGVDHVLVLSKPFKDENNSEFTNAIIDGGNVIYKVSAEKAKWLTVRPIDITSRTIIASYVWNISELTASAGGKSEKFSISLRDSSMSTTDAKNDDVIVKRNGEEFDTERYRLFYAFLIQCHGEDYALDEKVPDAEPMATVTIKDSFLGTETKYDFYDYSVMTSLIAINGECKFYGAKAFVNALTENVAKISTGEKYTDAY